MPGDPEQPPHDGLGAAAQKSRESDGLTGAYTDRIWTLDVRLDQGRAGGWGRGIRPILQTPGHGADEIINRKAAAPARCCDAAIAQYRAAIGDRHDLVELMRDIDDGRALRAHARQHGEQPRDFMLLEGGGRLVENEDAALPVERPADGDQLALGERERSHRAIDVGRKIELCQDCARVGAHAGAVDQGERPKLADRQIAERNIFSNRERRHKPQFLRDRDDASRDCIMRAREVAGYAVHLDLPAIGPVYAGQDANERRLAGAVLTDDRVNFAKPNVEVDPVERKRGAEVLAHVLGAGGRRHGLRMVVSAQRRRPLSSHR